MSDKVQGGTPKGSSSICLTCRNAQVIRGLNMQSEILCKRKPVLNGLVTFPVAQCSEYEDRRLPSLQNMYDIAWQVESRNRGPVGFGQNPDTEIRIVSPTERYSNMPTQPAAVPTSEAQQFCQNPNV